MQEINNLTKNYPTLEEAVVFAEKEISGCQKEIQHLEEEMRIRIRPHQARIRNLGKALKEIKKKIKAGESWCENWRPERALLHGSGRRWNSPFPKR